jgi:hypothetical protein
MILHKHTNIVFSVQFFINDLQLLLLQCKLANKPLYAKLN